MWVTYGKIYTKSGNVIPFAATKLDWEGGFDGITKLSYEFVMLSEPKIALVSSITPSQIEAIISEGAVEVEESNDT